MLNFHQSLPFLNFLFPLLHFLQDFPATISRKILPQGFPTRISHKMFPQDFPTRISRKIFPQQFPARISHNIFPHFLELDPDWLAPHHPFPNAKFPPITAFLKLAFSPPPFPARFFHKNFPQDFPELDPDWLAPHHPIPRAKFPTITALLNRPTYHKRLFPLLHFPQDFPATISCNNFPQDFPTTFSRNIFPQHFLELDPDWLAPHHPIPNAKFPPITAFLKLAFSPPPFPTRFFRKNFPQDFPARIFRKNFPQDFPTRISRAGSCLVSSPSPYSKC